MKQVILFLIMIIPFIIFSQEWKNIKEYKKINGDKELKQGNWLKKDRKKNDLRWINSNKYHIENKNGCNVYKTISQRRDFYKWFDNWLIKKGHEIKWVGIAQIVAAQFSKLDSKFVTKFIIRNKKVLQFATEGNKASFNDVFSRLRKLYLLDVSIRGTDAISWDSTYLYREQCVVVQPIFKSQNKKTLIKLSKMAKGRGFYKVIIPSKIRFNGIITNCSDRYLHGMNKLIPFYQSKKAKDINQIVSKK